LAGLVQNFTGIPNQFVGIGEWQGNADTGGGGIPPWGATAGPADLITGVPAGLAYLAQGLLGYLNPSTYLSTSLGNTLLRTYAWGSLPGSGIAEQLSGIGVGGLLDAVGIGGLLPSAAAPAAAVQEATVNRVTTTNENQSFTPDVAPNQGAPRDAAIANPGVDPGQAVTTPTKLVENAQEGIQNALDNVKNAGPKLNVQQPNPLDSGNAAVEGDTTGSHQPGAGKTPVRDLINKVTGGGKDQKDAAASGGQTGNTGAAG
jgi:hypothetical protein